jgi:hypothetical protein
MIHYLALILLGAALRSPPTPVPDPIQVRVEAILDLSARCIVDPLRLTYRDELEAALHRLLADPSDTADKTLARLLHYYLGDSAGEELLHAITVRGKRMLPPLAAEKMRRSIEVRARYPAMIHLPLSVDEDRYDTAIRYIQEGKEWRGVSANGLQSVPRRRGPTPATRPGHIADPIQVRVEAILDLRARWIVDERDPARENEFETALYRLLTDPSDIADKTLARLLHYYLGESNDEDVLHRITLRGRRMLPLLGAEKRNRPSQIREDYPPMILVPLAVDQDDYDTAIRYIRNGEVWGVD